MPDCAGHGSFRLQIFARRNALGAWGEAFSQVMCFSSGRLSLAASVFVSCLHSALLETIPYSLVCQVSMPCAPELQPKRANVSFSCWFLFLLLVLHLPIAEIWRSQGNLLSLSASTLQVLVFVFLLVTIHSLFQKALEKK